MEGSQLKAWRQTRGWTQQRAAAEIAVSLDLFRSMEQDRRSITAHTERTIQLLDHLASIGAEIPPSKAQENGMDLAIQLKRKSKRI